MGYSHNANCVSPKMTDYNVPSPAVVTESNYSSGLRGWHCFEQIDGEQWWYNSTAAPQWIQLDFGEGNSVLANGYTMTSCGNNGAYPGMPQAWNVQGSNNGSDWDTLDQRSGYTNWGSSRMMFCFFTYLQTGGTPTAYRYYKWNFTTKEAGVYTWQVAQIELIYDTVNVGYTHNANAVSGKMTDSSTPSPFVVSDSHHTGDSGGWRMFAQDGDLAGWSYTSSASDQWIKIDFGTPTIVNKYTLTPMGNNSIWKGMPRKWMLQGSNNDSDWTDLDSHDLVDVWPDDLMQTFTFVNTSAYRYYRLYLVYLQDGYYQWQIAELELIHIPSEGTFWINPDLTGGFRSMDGGYNW